MNIVRSFGWIIPCCAVLILAITVVAAANKSISNAAVTMFSLTSMIGGCSYQAIYFLETRLRETEEKLAKLAAKEGKEGD